VEIYENDCGRKRRGVACQSGNPMKEGRDISPLPLQGREEREKVTP